MITARLFMLPDQPESKQALEDLQALQANVPHQLAVVDVSQDPDLMRRYGDLAPVFQVGPYLLKGRFTRQEIQVALGAAADRAKQSEQVDQEGWEGRTRRGRTISRGDRLVYWISKHYLALFNLLLGVYVSLAFLAPVFMKIGWQAPAKGIYAVYSTVCHQFAFRSYFLFGEQAYYPRQLAGIHSPIQYEQIAPDPTVDIDYARSFTGNDTLGFKVALCERDIAIYSSLLLFGLIYGLSGRKIRRVHWLIYGLVGIVPIALDGFSQIPGILSTHLPTFLIFRESTPLIRTITGTLFGFFTGWFIFPLFEEAMTDTREFLATKISVASKIQNG